MAITFSPSIYPGGFNPIIPGTVDPRAQTSSGITSTINTSPVATPNLSQLMSQYTSQLSSSTSPSNFSAQYAEDPRLTQMVAAGMQRAGQSDAEISSQADGAYSAQRKQADNEIQRQLTRSLAANGVLPTGGLASQYYNEISAPVLDRINAQRAQTELDLRNARDNARNGITSTLAGIDNSKNQFSLSQLQAQQQAQYQAQQLAASQAYNQAQLSQQAALASQQLSADQARAAQQQALAQAELDYRKQSDAQSLAFQQQQAALNRQDRLSSGGLTNGYGSTGGGSLSNGFDLGAKDSAQMQQNYNNLWNGTPESTWGKSTYKGDGSAQGKYPVTSQSTTPTQSSSSSSPVSWSGNTYAGSAPTSSFYNPPASGSNFSPPGSMFYYS